MKESRERRANEAPPQTDERSMQKAPVVLTGYAEHPQLNRSSRWWSVKTVTTGADDEFTEHGGRCP